MDFTDAQAKYIRGEFKLKGQFNNGGGERETVLDNAERYAGWTLPNIFPDENLSESDEMQNDFQSVGAQAVINLSNKITMSLFPAARPFFKMDLSKKQKEDALEEMDEATVTSTLAAQEREAMKEFATLNGRVTLTNVVQNLMIAGNSCLYMPPDEKMSNFSLRDYTIKRDLRGNLVKLILCESKGVDALSDELAALVGEYGYEHDMEVKLYTCVQRYAKDKYIVWQEIEDVGYCHKRVGNETTDTLPWIPLTWDLVRGKDYGTGLVESYSGDFHTLSSLAEAILDYTVILTDVKTLVNPAGQTDVNDIIEAPSGAYVLGVEEDLYVHTPNVSGATDFLEKQFAVVERRIGVAFLMNSSVTRDAERVTAEEIRMQALELESSLGGVYSRLAEELQLPLAKRLLVRLDKEFKDIVPIVVTGLESLSRSSQLDRIRAFFSDLVALSDVPEEVKDWIDYAPLIAEIGAGHGVDYSKFLLDKDVADQRKAERAKHEAAAAGLEAGAVNQAQNQGQ